MGAIEAFRDSDVTVANIEMVINDWLSPCSPLTGATWAITDPKNADQLARIAIGLAILANNHVSEFGVGGQALTQEALDRLDITHAGVGKTLGAAQRARCRDNAAGRVALLSATSNCMPDAPTAAHPRADAAAFSRPRHGLPVHTQYVANKHYPSSGSNAR
ncbi:hypothetical protein EOA88_10560 [Mesorhizobium sp. M5C.F.Ca.IN.020.14.1.1]|nr:hypothetical protein EOA88_10560 [Mesorhizobium sp. M5C.F.Ca.IN.020.14.1.1]